MADDRPRWGRARIAIVLALFLLAALRGGLPWIHALATHPDEPLSVTALYRAGTDPIYFVLARALGEGNLGEMSAAGARGEGLRSFPFPLSVLHGAGWAVAGLRGLVLADLLTAVLLFGALALLLRELVPTWIAIALALALLYGLVPQMPEWRPFPMVFWGLRYPRPWVSVIFVVVALLALSRALRADAGPRAAAVAGVALGLLAQVDPYNAQAFGVLAACWIGVELVRSHRRQESPRRVLALALAGGIVMIPFALQAAFIQPDLPARLGVFSFRAPTLVLPYPLAVQHVRLMVLIGGALTLLRQLVMGRRTARALAPGATALLLGLPWFDLSQGTAPPIAVLAVLLGGGSLAIAAAPRDRAPLPGVIVAIATASLVSMPLVTTIASKGLQLYHYETTTLQLASLAIVLLVVSEASQLLGPLARRRVLRRAGIAFGLVGLAILIGYRVHAEREQRHVALEQHPFAYCVGVWRGHREARSELGQLIDVLRPLAKDGAATLGTLDIAVSVLWSLDGGGALLLPDPSLSGLPDVEQERRLLVLLRLLRVPSVEIDRLLNRWVIAWWLGANRYHLSAAHTPAPLSDYDEEHQALARSIRYPGWALALPRSLRKDLRQRYDRGADIDRPPVDVIVVGRDLLAGQYSPDPRRYELIYESEMYRAWALRSTR